jgi:hypothetical protein
MHDALGRAGVHQTCAYMQQHVHWRGLPGDMKLFVAHCDARQRRKFALPAPFPLQEPVIRGPSEHVHIDLCGPFVTPCADLHGQLYLPQPPQPPLKAWVIVMIDDLTKAAEFAVIYDKTAASYHMIHMICCSCVRILRSYITKYAVI